MEKKEKVTVVRIEINSGTFTIPAGDKLYEITVRQNPTISEMLDTIVVNELSAQHAADGKSSDIMLPQDLHKISLYYILILVKFAPVLFISPYCV